MPHVFQRTKRCRRFTTVLAIAAFLTFPAHMVGQERVDPMATTVGQSFAMIEQSFIALAGGMADDRHGEILHHSLLTSVALLLLVDHVLIDLTAIRDGRCGSRRLAVCRDDVVDQ